MAMPASRAIRRRRIARGRTRGRRRRGFRRLDPLERRPRAAQPAVDRGRRTGVQDAGAARHRNRRPCLSSGRTGGACAHRQAPLQHGVAAIPRQRSSGLSAAVGRPLIHRVERRAVRGGALARPGCRGLRRCPDRGQRRGLGELRTVGAAGELSSQAAVRLGVRAAARRAARRCRARGASAGRPGIESGAAGLRRPRRGSRAGGRRRLFRRAPAAAAL